MQYYVIYSAGGGSGDWKGVKRVRNGLPQSIKGHILLKFGDLYFNHAGLKSVIKQNIWESENNIRKRFSEGVSDAGILKGNCDILLDSGTSKIVAYVQDKFGQLSTSDQIAKFVQIVNENQILQKYASVVIESKINNAVTFDIPNLFKIRTQIETGRITNVFDENDHKLIIEETAKMCNTLHNLMGDKSSILLTTLNANRTNNEISDFIKKLNYVPSGYAIGGLTTLSENDFNLRINQLNALLKLDKQPRVHFLGAGGLKPGVVLKNIFIGESFSADVSTPWNRAIDGNLGGTAQSGYYDYATKKLIRITEQNKPIILNKHMNVQDPLFNLTEIEDIIDKILLHQNRQSSDATYDARARLYFHNCDVYKRNLLS